MKTTKRLSVVLMVIILIIIVLGLAALLTVAIWMVTHRKLNYLLPTQAGQNITAIWPIPVVPFTNQVTHPMALCTVDTAYQPVLANYNSLLLEVGVATPQYTSLGGIVTAFKNYAASTVPILPPSNTAALSNAAADVCAVNASPFIELHGPTTDQSVIYSFVVNDDTGRTINGSEIGYVNSVTCVRPDVVTAAGVGAPGFVALGDYLSSSVADNSRSLTWAEQYTTQDANGLSQTALLPLYMTVPVAQVLPINSPDNRYCFYYGTAPNGTYRKEMYGNFYSLGMDNSATAGRPNRCIRYFQTPPSPAQISQWARTVVNTPNITCTGISIALGVQNTLYAIGKENGVDPVLTLHLNQQTNNFMQRAFLPSQQNFKASALIDIEMQAALKYIYIPVVSNKTTQAGWHFDDRFYKPY